MMHNNHVSRKAIKFKAAFVGSKSKINTCIWDHSRANNPFCPKDLIVFKCNISLGEWVHTRSLLNFDGHFIIFCPQNIQSSSHYRLKNVIKIIKNSSRSSNWSADQIKSQVDRVASNNNMLFDHFKGPAGWVDNVRSDTTDKADTIETEPFAASKSYIWQKPFWLAYLAIINIIQLNMIQ